RRSSDLGRTLDRHHGTSGIGKEVLGEIGHERKRIRKSFSKELDQRGLGGQLLKTVPAIKRKKEYARERTINIGQCDQHVIAARPNVQCVGFKHMSAFRARRNRQLFVSVIEVLLREVEPASL